jgi:hypothetical protein
LLAFSGFASAHLRPPPCQGQSKRWLRARGKRVLLYFSIADLPQGHDRGQFALLQEYKAELKKDTLYWEFKTVEELGRLFSGHLASVVHEIAATIGVQPRPTSARVSSLVSLKPMPAHRSVGADENDVWREVIPAEDAEDALRAAIAIFRNDQIQGAPLPRINSLRAQITFYSARGGEVQRVNYGTWLGSPYNRIELGLGDTLELLIAVDHPRATSPRAIENMRSGASNYSEEGFREKPLERKLYDVNVRLIGSAKTDGDVLNDFHFNLDLRGEWPILKPEWTRWLEYPSFRVWDGCPLALPGRRNFLG